MFVAMRIDYRHLQKYGYLIYFAIICLLLLVYVPGLGKTVNGAQRWIALGPATFQPSEFAKIGMIIFFSGLLAKKQKEGKIQDFMFGYVPVMTALGIVFLLIHVQPDLGTAVIVALVSVFLFAIAGIRISYLMTTAIIVMPILVAAVANVGYRRKRILAFLDPWGDASDTGYQIIQSFIALAQGGLYGTGIGAGHQKLFFLPEPHTDFIFSIIGEELGLLGAVVIIFLYMVLAWRGFKIGLSAPDRFGALLALGITFCITLQAAINLSVVMGILPTKGLPLPLVSLGGSALVMWLLSIGILLNVSEHTA